MDINHYLGHTFIISLSEDVKKRSRLVKNLHSLGVYPELFITERITDIAEGLIKTTPRTDRFFISKPGELGCMHSHYTLVKMAKLRGLPKITIIEDDSLVMKDWERTVGPSFDAVPEDWHFLYLNSCPRFPDANFEFISNKRIVRAWCFSCTSAYTIRDTFYDRVIENFESGIYVADNVYGWLQNMDPNDKNVPDWTGGPHYSKEWNMYGLNPSLFIPNTKTNSSIREANEDHEFEYHIKNNFTVPDPNCYS